MRETGGENDNNFIMKGLEAWELGDSCSNSISITKLVMHTTFSKSFPFTWLVTSSVRVIWPGSATSLLFSNVQFYNSKQWGNGQVFHCERKTEDGSDSNLENQFGAVTDRM